MHRPPLASRLLAAALCAVAAGCGASPEEQARTTTTEFLAAMRAADGAAACEHLGDSGRFTLGQAAFRRGLAATGDVLTDERCEAAATALARAERPAFERLATARITSIFLRRTRGVVRTSAGMYKLAVQDGDWVVGELPTSFPRALIYPEGCVDARTGTDVQCTVPAAVPRDLGPTQAQ